MKEKLGHYFYWPITILLLLRSNLIKLSNLNAFCDQNNLKKQKIKKISIQDYNGWEYQADGGWTKMEKGHPYMTSHLKYCCDTFWITI